jgi:hypothetical protein
MVKVSEELLTLRLESRRVTAQQLQEGFRSSLAGGLRRCT